MKVLVVLALCVALAAASGYHKPGFRRGKNAIVARYNNAERQEAVNYKAEHIGRSSGTARWEGVPGTDLDFGYGYNRGYDRYGYDSYDRHDGYGYDRYDHHDGYGYDKY